MVLGGISPKTAPSVTAPLTVRTGEKVAGLERKVFFSWFSSLRVDVLFKLSSSMASGNQQTDKPTLAKQRRHESRSSLGPPRQDYLKSLIVNTDLTLLTKKHTHFLHFYLMARSHSSFD